MASTTSRTWPTRPSGWTAGELGPGFRGIGPVWMTPGETAFTRMPRDAYSTASARVAAAKPPFVSDVRTEGSFESA